MFSSPKPLFIILWNVAGALAAPKGIVSHYIKTKWATSESSIRLAFLNHFHLPITSFQI